MSKAAFEDIFTFAGRRNRKSYILYYIGIMAAVFVLYGVMAMIAAMAEAWWPLVLAYLLMLPLALSGWAVIAQRCRDFGWTGWAALITLIRIIGFLFSLALLFIPGDPGTNRYGPDPLAAG